MRGKVAVALLVAVAAWGQVQPGSVVPPGTVVSGTGITFPGSVSVGTTVPTGGPSGVVGAASLYSPNGGLHAFAFPGSDCGAKINAALALATNQRVLVERVCGTAITTAISIGANQSVEFLEGGTYTISAPITMGSYSSLIGLPTADTLIAGAAPVVIKQASGANLAQMVLANTSSSTIRDISFDGNYTVNGSAGPNIVISSARVRLERVNSYNSNSHGVQIGTSTTLQGVGSTLVGGAYFGNQGSGVLLSKVTDIFILGHAEFENNARYGIETVSGAGAAGVRIAESDFGGNTLGGIYIAGAASWASWGWIIIGNQFGNNLGHDIDIESTTGVAYSYGHTIQGNQFIGLGPAATTNTYSPIRSNGAGASAIVGNAMYAATFGPAYKYCVNIAEPAANQELADEIQANQCIGSYGSGYITTTASTHFSSNFLGVSDGLTNALAITNGTALKWRDASNVNQSILQLDGSNNVYLTGHPTAKSIILQPNPGTTRFSCTDAQCVVNGVPLFAPLYTGAGAIALQPGADSTTAVKVNNASGTAIVTVDTTASAVGTSLATLAGITSGSGGNTVTLGNQGAGAGEPGIWFGTGSPTSSNYSFAFDAGNGGTLFNAPGTINPISFRLNNLTQATIKTSGNFLIGGTTDGNYRLDVQKSGASGTARFYDQTATTGATRVLVSLGAADSSTTTTLTNAGVTASTGGFSSGFATYLMTTTAALTAGSTANVPTLTSGPVTGNPTKWIAINDNGTTRYIPSW